MLVKEDFIMRCFYYVNDVHSQFSHKISSSIVGVNEECIEEGIPVLNGAQRFLVMECLK